MAKVVKRYLIVFFLFYVLYSFLNWWLTIKTGWIKIDNDNTVSFFSAFLLGYICIFFFLRPVINRSSCDNKTKDGLLWGMIPLFIGLPTVFSQEYFRDVSYEVINVKTPEEVRLYPRERFFSIDHFAVFKNEFSLFKERHVERKSLDVNNYYIAPLYADSSGDAGIVACCIKYHTSFNNGYFSKSKRSEKISAFNKESAAEFANYNPNEIGFFEKPVGSDAINLSDAWKNNEWLDPALEPVILISKKETFKSFIARKRNISIYSVLISVVVVLGALFWIDFRNTRKISENT